MTSDSVMVSGIVGVKTTSPNIWGTTEPIMIEILPHIGYYTEAQIKKKNGLYLSNFF